MQTSTVGRWALGALLLGGLGGCSTAEADPESAETEAAGASEPDGLTGGGAASASSSESTADSGTNPSGTSGDSTTASSGPEDDGVETEADTEADPPDTDSSDDTTGDEGGDPPHADVRNYIFGHSLIRHAPDSNIPIWLTAMADEAGYSYGMSGQYGFASTHADELPPDPAWGIEGVTSVWDEDSGESFSDVGFNTVLFTEGNFFQYLAPTESEPGAMSSVENTLAVFDWVDAAQPGVRYIIYENWPDMAGYTDASFEGEFPSGEEVAAYHAYTQGEFHQWWVDYRDAIASARPELEITMVPVGSVMADLLTTTLSDIPPEDLYLDNAPHGTPTLYFLAGVITYMGMYGNRPPASYVPPEWIHPVVRERYGAIVDEAWAAL